MPSLIPIYNEQHSIPNQWVSSYYLKSKFFNPLKSLWSLDNQVKWPTLEEYNHHYQNIKQGTRWSKVKFIAPDRIKAPLSRYEASIHYHSEVPTRTENWHDFFNYCIWLEWPQSKWALNERTVANYLINPQAQFKKRNTVQNQLARFDECGLVIYGDHETLQLIRAHQWQTLFVERAKQFHQHCHIKIFGHALFEKLLNPYIGLTGFALLIEGRPDAHFDTVVSEIIQDKSRFLSRGSLHPFPLLGVPEYYPPNEDRSFYNNKRYFRAQRSDV